MSRRIPSLTLLASVTAVVVALQGALAVAQTYPTKPIRLVVTYPPGGSSDLMGRVLGQKLGDQLGQQIIVESKPGASGSIGTEFAARQPADGYTLLWANMQPIAMNPLLSKVPYDAQKDLLPVSMAAAGPNVLVVNANSPFKSLKELIDAGRAKPGSLNFGTSGPGSLSHLAGELMKRAVPLDMVAVQYKGSALVTQDLLAGNLHMVISDALPVMAHIKSGKLRPLAVTSEKRITQLPDVPTFGEGGVNGLVTENWWGIMLPAGTPKPIVDRLHAEIVKALAAPEVTQKFADLGVQARSSTPEEFRTFIQAEIGRWAKLVKEANIKAE